MISLPTPKLGEVTAITITTPDLELSAAFYKKLGFQELFRSDFPFPLIQISDGALLMMLRQDKKPYIALTYYSKEIDRVIDELKKEMINVQEMPTPNNMVRRYLFQSPDGLTISIVSFVDGFTQPPGPTMLTMPQEDYMKPEKYVNKTCGMFGEFAHPVKNLDASISFWEKLGFKTLSKFSSPYPWAIASDGLAVVGLHQTNHFEHPAITYFAKDMQDKIAALREQGITEITDTKANSNITLKSPEGQHINLFKLGM